MHYILEGYQVKPVSEDEWLEWSKANQAMRRLAEDEINGIYV